MMTTRRQYHQQVQPHLGNQFLEDSSLLDWLNKNVPPNVLKSISPDLERFGWRVVNDIYAYGKDAESHLPTVKHVDGWGKRIDEIKTAEGWSKLNDVSAEEGLIGHGYQRKYGEWSRVYQYTKLHLFNPSSATYTCPLAMADGAARLIEVLKAQGIQHPKLTEAFARLTSFDPKTFWTSGQWMTEKTGGSDVGSSETIALKQQDGTYALHGYKFFTSATTSQMAFTLARIQDQTGKTVAGSRGLSLFFVELRNDRGQLNNIVVHKLKEKLGTKALPTAELELVGTPALLVGAEGRGVPNIATLFNITRIQQGVASVSTMRRGIAIARDYAHRRVAFGEPLVQKPLHIQTLAKLEMTYRGCLFFFFDTVHLLGRVETLPNLEDEDSLLRILTPLLKLYTAKESLSALSECIECLGGLGYMEDATELPNLFRTQQVGTIWEGTTNVLSLDLLRALAKVGIEPYAKRVRKLVSNGKSVQGLGASIVAIEKLIDHIEKFVSVFVPNAATESQARNFAYLMSSVYCACALVEFAKSSRLAKDIHVANKWVNEKLLTLPLPVVGGLDESSLRLDRAIALDEDPITGRPRGTGPAELRAKF